MKYMKIVTMIPLWKDQFTWTKNLTLKFSNKSQVFVRDQLGWIDNTTETIEMFDYFPHLNVIIQKNITVN